MKQPRALTEPERTAVLEVLRSDRFVDKAPAEIQAILLDEGTYLCSVATMYRLLRAHGETGERRAQAEHPARVKPELIATGPNMTWSWDISKLKGPAKWSYFHLYTIIDIYSRYVVGWMVATRESHERGLHLGAVKCGDEAGCWSGLPRIVRGVARLVR